MGAQDQIVDLVLLVRTWRTPAAARAGWPRLRKGLESVLVIAGRDDAGAGPALDWLASELAGSTLPDDLRVEADRLVARLRDRLAPEAG